MPVSTAVSGAVACLGCSYPLPVEEITSAEGTRCPRCQSRQLGRLFKAAFTGGAPAAFSQLAALGEATCFHHPTKRAAVPCDSCGRFLCTLCQFTLGNQNLCPSCIESARKQGTQRWIARRVNMDSVALAIATVPLVGIWTSLIGAPVSLYMGIRALRQPPGPIPRAKWRAIVAIVLGSIQVIAWGVLIVVFFWAVISQGRPVG